MAQLFCSHNAYPFIHFSENHLFFQNEKLYWVIADTWKLWGFFKKNQKFFLPLFDS